MGIFMFIILLGKVSEVLSVTIPSIHYKMFATAIKIVSIIVKQYSYSIQYCVKA